MVIKKTKQITVTMESIIKLLHLPFPHEIKEESEYLRKRIVEIKQKTRELSYQQPIVTDAHMHTLYSLRGFICSYYWEGAREFLEAKCALLRKAIPFLNKRSVNPSPGKPRIGFISCRLGSGCSIFNTSRGFICGTDPKEFDVYVICDKNIGLWPDNVKYVKIPQDLVKASEIIEGLGLSIAVYTDIGICGFTDLLAMQRLAPIQVTTWGHSDTSGMDSIDYYISSKLYEIPGAQQFYTEKLVLHEGVNGFFESAPVPIDRKASKEASKILIAASPLKWNKHFISTLKKLSKRIKCTFVVTEYYQNPIFDILRAKGIKLEVHAQKPLPEYKKMIESCKYVLDTFPFGNCNTTMHAFTMGKVVVTLPSDRLYGRFTQGFYKRIGVSEPVASNDQDFIDIACKFHDDTEYRLTVEDKILRNHHKVFRSHDSIQEYNKTWRDLLDKSWLPLHIIFGLRGEEELSLAHFVSVWSAMYHLNPGRVIFWYRYEPKGEWWDILKPFVEMRKAGDIVIHGTKVVHYAHQADVIRLRALSKYGGTYVDIDTVTLKPWGCNGGVTLGAQKLPKGVSNAMISCAPESSFIKSWLNEYKSFKNCGADSSHWNRHSVDVPTTISILNPNVDIRLDLCPLTPNDAEEKLTNTDLGVFPGKSGVHLYESAWVCKTREMTLDSINGTTYWRLVSPYFVTPNIVHTHGDVEGTKVWSEDDARRFVSTRFPGWTFTWSVFGHLIVYSVGGHWLQYVEPQCDGPYIRFGPGGSFSSPKGHRMLLELAKRVKD